jgi:hypothetical protein
MAIYLAVPLLMHLTALYWTRLEIQIEGRFPWGGSLPCWKRRTGFKEVTGYHTNLSYLFLMLILLVVVFFSALASANLFQDLSLLVSVLSIFPLGKVAGIIFIFISCFIMIIGDEDSMWNTTHPSKKFTIKAYSRKQFPAAGLVWLIPRDYFYYVILSGFFFGIAHFIAGYNMWIWLWYFLTMLVMNLNAISMEQARNKKSGDELRFDEFARKHAFYEGRLDEKGELILPEKAMLIVAAKFDGKIKIEVMDVEIIHPGGRYSGEYGQSNYNPDLLENRLTQEIDPETTIASLLK